MKKKYLLAGLIIWLLLLSGGLYYYFKPHRSAGNLQTDLAIDAATLYSDYAKDEATSNQKYMDKIIEVKGRITELHLEGKSRTVELDGGSPAGGINCSLSGMDKLPAGLRTGSLVTIKGRCSGFLADVNLVDCVIQP
jgi:hypothetical protein